MRPQALFFNRLEIIVAIKVVLLLSCIASPARAQCPGGGTDNGILKVNSDAALTGECGLEIVIQAESNDQAFVRDTNPSAETDYWARFYFDPNSVNFTSTSSVKIFELKSNTTVGTTKSVFFISLRRKNGSYQLTPRVYKDNGVRIPVDKGVGWEIWQTISDAPHWIEIHWYQASSPSVADGGFGIWIDGVKTGERTNAKNGQRVVDYAQLGIFSKQLKIGSSGSFYLDAFESRQTGPIGPSS